MRTDPASHPAARRLRLRAVGPWLPLVNHVGVLALAVAGAVLLTLSAESPSLLAAGFGL